MFCIGVNSVSRIAESIGEKIRMLRQERGLSQERLAFKAGMNTSYIGQVERAEKSPTIDTIEKITLALDITIEEIFRMERVNSQKPEKTVIEKIMFQLDDRTEMEQEAIYQLVKQILLFKDKI